MEWPPAVSVVTPSHRPHYVDVARRSVRAQSVGSIEHLLNEGSLWHIDKVNDLVRGAHGKFFVNLGDDDELADTFVSETLSLAQQTDADVVFTGYTSAGEHVPAFYVAPQPVSLARFKSLLKGVSYTAPPITSLIRTALFHAEGGYDGEQLYYDWDLYYRLFKAGAMFAFIDKSLWRYRQDTLRASPGIDRAEAVRRLVVKHPELAV